MNGKHRAHGRRIGSSVAALLAHGAAIAMVVGCMVRDLGDANYLSVSQSAKFISLNGTSLVMGRAFLPAALQDPKSDAQAEVPLTSGTAELVDDHRAVLPGTSGTSLDAGGSFRFEHAPANQPLFVRIRFTHAGRDYQMFKLVSPSAALTCARVSLASSLIAAKLLSPKPWLKNDPGLSLADLLPLVNLSRLQEAEQLLVTKLRTAAPTIGELLDATALNAAADAFSDLAMRHGDLADAYCAAAEPNAAFQIGVASVAENKAAIPGLERKDKVVYGVLNLQLFIPPQSIDFVEYLLDGQPVASASAPETSWHASFDTWKVPDGPHTIASRGWHAGTTRPLTASYVNVQNTIDYQCPESSDATNP